MDGLAFRENPDSERWVEIVHAFEQPLTQATGMEQQRMDSPAFCELDDALDIDLDQRGVELNRKPPRAEPMISRSFKGGAQFTNDLPQRAAGFFLVRTAPQQPDQPFAAFLLGFDEGKITEHRARLLGAQFDRLSVESDREPADQ